MLVVVPDAHLPSALALIRELGAAGHVVWAVCEGDKPPVGLHSRFVSRGIHMAPGLTRPDIREAMLNILHQAGKPVFMPLSRETIEMVAHRKQFFDIECYTLVPDNELLVCANDKRRVYKTAASLGLKTPCERHFLNNESIADFAVRQPTPVVLKYYDGERLFLPPGRRYTVAGSERVLLKRYSIMHDVQSPVLVQDYVEGRCWGVGLVLDKASRPIGVMCHERMRQYPTTGGPGTLCRSVWLPGMAKAAAALAAQLRLTGFVYVEFKGDQNDFTLMDVSPRAWHSLPLARLCNLRLGQAYVDAAFDAKPESGLQMRYTPDKKLQYFWDDFRAGWSLALTGRPDWLFQSIRDGVSSKVNRAIMEKGDRRPFFKMLTLNVTANIKMRWHGVKKRLRGYR